jgi:hypothetical protein
MEYHLHLDSRLNPDSAYAKLGITGNGEYDLCRL